MRRRILVLHEDRSILESLVAHLRRNYLAAEGVQSAIEAMEQLNRDAADLLLAEVRMESLDGMAFLRATRAVLPDLPITVVTADGCEETMVEALRIGVSDYVVEPYDPDVLARRVGAVLDANRILQIRTLERGEQADRMFAALIRKRLAKPLSVIGAYSAFLSLRDDLPADVRACFDHMALAGSEIGKIMEELEHFSRARPAATDVHSPMPILKDETLPGDAEDWLAWPEVHGRTARLATGSAG